MSNVVVNHGDHCELDSPRNCVHCGQVLTVTATVDSVGPSVSDADYDWADEALSSDPVERHPRVVVSEPSLVSSRSSTPLEGFVPPPPPAPLTGSDEECASLLSSDIGGYASSDDLDSEYVSAMEVPPQSGGGVTGERESADTFNELDDADVFGSTYDNANDELEVSSLDDDDDDEAVLPLNSTLQESSNSASTLLEEQGDASRKSGQTAQSSSDDDSDDDDDDRLYGEEMVLLGEVSDDDADGEDDCLAAGSNPTEPLLAPAGDSDLSDAN